MKDILPALFRDKLRNQDGHCSSFFFSPLCHLDHILNCRRNDIAVASRNCLKSDIREVFCKFLCDFSILFGSLSC